MKDETRRAVIYTRVSTSKQADVGHGLDAQYHKCRGHCESNGLEVVAHLSDEGVSGGVAVRRRPKMAEAIAMLEAGVADTLVVATLSRIGRRTIDVLKFVEWADNRGWSLVMLDVGDTASPMGRAILGIMAVVSQLERDYASQRTREGLAEAKKKGVKLGGYRGVPPKPAAATKRAGERVLQLRSRGVTWRAIGPRLEEEGYRTARGKRRWQMSSVQHAAKIASRG